MEHHYFLYGNKQVYSHAPHVPIVTQSLRRSTRWLWRAQDPMTWPKLRIIVALTQSP